MSLAVHEPKLAIIGCHHPSESPPHPTHQHLTGLRGPGEDAQQHPEDQRGASHHSHRTSSLH